MSDPEYNETRKRELESFSNEQFRVDIAVRSILFDDLTLSPGSSMTVFSSQANGIYGLIESDDAVRLGSIEKMVKEAGFVPIHYYTPGGLKNYFIQRAYNIFTSVYPARHKWTNEEETYYQLLVPYSPALVRLGGVRGSIRRFNRFSNSWEIIYEPSDHLRLSGRRVHESIR